MDDYVRTSDLLSPSRVHIAPSVTEFEVGWDQFALDAKDYFKTKGGASRVGLEWRRAAEEAKYLASSPSAGWASDTRKHRPQQHQQRFHSPKPFTTLFRHAQSSPNVSAIPMKFTSPSPLRTRSAKANIDSTDIAVQNAIVYSDMQPVLAIPVTPSISETRFIPADVDALISSSSRANFSARQSFALNGTPSVRSFAPPAPQPYLTPMDAILAVPFGDDRKAHQIASNTVRRSVTDKAAVAIQRIVRGWLCRMHMYLWLEARDYTMAEVGADTFMGTTRQSLRVSVYDTDRRISRKEQLDAVKAEAALAIAAKKESIAAHRASLLALHREKSSCAAVAEARHEAHAKLVITAATQAMAEKCLATGMELLSSSPQIRAARQGEWLAQHRNNCEVRWKREGFSFADDGYTASHEDIISHVEWDPTGGIKLLDLL